MKTIVQIYIDDGRKMSYEVDSPIKAREHAYQIIQTGYRHTEKGSNDLEWIPPHRILKIKIPNGGESTAYRDKVEAT